MQKQQVLIIVGPTGSGKSSLAVKLAKRYGGEIISADSRQVYRGLDIATGKVTKREMCGIRHHLIDVVSPKRSFTAQDFVDRAKKAIDDIAGRGTLPIIAGGTGFYIDALTGRIQLSPVAPNKQLRTRLEKKTTAQLFAMLKKLDPKRAKSVDPRNKRRLIRAIEIATESGGRPKAGRRNTYDTLWIGIDPKGPILRRKIRLRIAQWMRRGLIAEVKRLRKEGVSWKRIGEFGFEYSLVGAYLRGELKKEELPSRMESATWRYARKQMGYWRRNKDINWFDSPSTPAIEKRLHAWRAMVKS